MAGLIPIGKVIRDSQVRTYFQCCCALRRRPAGEGAPQNLATAYTFLERAAGQGEYFGPLAPRAGKAIEALRRPSLIERAFADAGFAFDPPPDPGSAA